MAAVAMALAASRSFFLSCPNPSKTFLLSTSTSSRTFFLSTSTASPSLEPNPAPSSSLNSKHVVEILQDRGLIESITSENLKSYTNIKAYCGFDPTAESLHQGNLIGLIVLSRFKRRGHVPIALVGGATGRVGDTSRKGVERPELDAQTIEQNYASIKTLIKGILFEQKRGAKFGSRFQKRLALNFR